MKILQIIFSLSSGGAEKISVDLSNELSKNHEVYFCVILRESQKLSFFKQALNKNIKYINLGCSKGINFRTFFSAFEIINRIRPDIIHLHLNTILYFYLPALFYKSQIKFIHTLHNIAPKTIRFGWQKKLNIFFYSRRIIIPIAISQKCKDSFVQFYGINQVDLIENGVSKPKHSINFENVKLELESFKHSYDDLILIHVARFSEQKNQKLLIDSFNKLIDNNIGAILIVLGSGFNSVESQNLKRLNQNRIYFLGAKQNVCDYLFNSDVFVLTSLWEGLPISLLEALSCGVIPICTPAGGIPDVITEEALGYVSRDFTKDEYFKSLSKCLLNIENFDRTHLVKYFDLNFSIRNCANNYLMCYLE